MSETPTESPMRVQAEGLPDTLEFPAGTSTDVIQSTVKRLQQEKGVNQEKFAHLPEQMAAAGGMAGATLGQISPIPGGRMIGAAAGAAGMHYAGKTIQDVANGIEPTIETITDNLLSAGKMGLTSGAAEGAFPILGDLLAPIGKQVADIGAKLGNKLFVPKTSSEVVKTAEGVLSKVGAPSQTLGQMADDPASKHIANTME
ncbi:MAG: hypothetical protein KGI70_03450, partial [Patescibacteria group bacterium]|nr:hypothetical protein [Patescibacteria group bacterium]